MDETGWPEGEQQKWLWINATADVTTFRALPGRGAAEAKKVISESAKGIITSDRLAAYNWLEERRRQVCWAHLKRDFQAVAERKGDSTETGQTLLEQVKEVFTLWHQVRNCTLSRVEFQVRMEPIQAAGKRVAAGRFTLDASEDTPYLPEHFEAVGISLDLCARRGC